ncbi:MAG TPA: L,D-transpeptidase family protein [Thermoanaerobaculia bacterium]|nr:L,D-transpeptidase family protein [Thermoanaerobaculia bacterium]
MVAGALFAALVGIGALPIDQVTPAATSTGGASLRAVAESGHLSDLRWPDFSDYVVWLTRFYGPADYAPAWIEAGQPTAQSVAMIALFRAAGKKGLQPEDYDASRWDGRIEALKSGNGDPVRFDVALTVCTMRLVSDLRIGRVNPKHFDFGLSVDQKKYDLARFLRERLLPAPNVSAVLDSVEPPWGGYRRTEAALARYVELAQRDGGEALPSPASPVRPGQGYAGTPLLFRRLTLLGDLPADATPSAEPVYDGALVEAVRRFQRRHGLDDDGRLGPATVQQLNVPLSDRVRQLQLALERWRWLPDEFSAPPIVVNIPDFRLRAVERDDQFALNMRVVVGKAMRTETPVFSKDMTYVVLRPYWNVPPSILRKEIVPAIRRDRDYIAKKGFEVTTNDGKVVTDGVISDDVLARLQAGALSVRQKPGPANALGLVKLIFPNEHNVYLHSTPAPELFARSRRDFSHGCIRVEKPAELAAWVLRNNTGWPLERVQSAMKSGPDDVTVKLVTPVPVFIVYATALAYEDGQVHFYDDLYGYDASLVETLAKGYPYP